MNSYHFKFGSRYQGLWEIDGLDEEVAGVLTIDDFRIQLEIYYKGGGFLSTPKAHDIIGKVFVPKKDETQKDQQYQMRLENLHLIRGTYPSNGIKHLVYDVENVYVYQSPLQFDGITSICFHSPLIDKWVRSIMLKSYSHKELDFKTGHAVYEINPPESLPLLNSKQYGIDAYIYFGWEHNSEMQGLSYRSKSFLNVAFAKEKTFKEACFEAEKFKYLMCLLTGVVFEPEHYEFHTKQERFVYKRSNRHSLVFCDLTLNLSPITAVNDFNEEVLAQICRKWNNLYDEYFYAIEKYTAAISNIYTSPEDKIKNYLSCLDSFTEEKVPLVEFPETKEGSFLVSLFSKFDSLGSKITKQDKKHLKDLLLRNMAKSLRVRLQPILESIGDILPNGIDGKFIDDAVTVRHALTHPKRAKETKILTSFNLKDTALKLELLTGAYILFRIGVKKDIIKKLIYMF